MIVLTEQIEIPASYEKLKAWTANFEEEFVKWSPYHIECNLYNGNYHAGSKVRFREIVMGLDYDVTGTITECEQDENHFRIVFRSDKKTAFITFEGKRTKTGCHLFCKPKKKFLCLSVNIRKIGIQFTAGQQIGISPTVMLLETAEMPLPPYPDWPIFLRLIIPGNQIIVSNQFIFQPCAFICDKSLHLYNLLFLSAIIIAGKIAEIECANKRKTRRIKNPPGINISRKYP